MKSATYVDPNTRKISRIIRSSHQRPGTQAVEFAMVAPLFFIIIFGLLELGRGFMVMHLLSNSAREGCRYALEHAPTNSGIQDQVKNYLATQGVSGATTSILINNQGGDISQSAKGDVVTINISIPVSKFSWIPGSTYLHGNLVGRYSLQKE